jgi:hypothetical protein
MRAAHEGKITCPICSCSWHLTEKDRQAILAEFDLKAAMDRLDYDPDTGYFVWKVANKRRRAGERAGYVGGGGYVYIGINRQLILAHRLVWWFVYGRGPMGDIDHINRDKTDNRLSNLRDVTESQNLMNRPAPRNNTSGQKGVSWHAKEKRWRAKITVNKKTMFLGSFSTIEDAGSAYRAASVKYHGEYAHKDG